ncbi:SDR family oxidoreductase [Chromobacterium haemolyticum]|nr:SDR family oxidoreductase [Chromobacterium haemolyticum]
MIEDAIARAPQNRLVEIEDVGTTCAFLISEAARGLTGQTIYVDGGHHIKA